ncbi:aminopeptidase P family protein [Cryptosporangium phraense]|uniref:Xaa-Pro aminopeptidase n=1 Tax=Cryptosporangium phraense TaxID=2593070 RepID=A0A545AF29_9ACTN|nr:aminopeptidase P family protein [Cryptosporangium phraense]
MAELAEADPSITTASHDLPVPERLAEFMRTGWGAPPASAVSREPSAPFTAARRTRLAERFPGETLVIPSGTAKVRSNDSSYEFRPGSDLAWLTTCYEQDAVLVAGPGGATLYVRVRASRDSDEFFRSRGGELWVGPRRSAADWSAALGLTCASLDALPKALAELDPAATRVLRSYDAQVDASLDAIDDGLRDGQLAAALGELRLVKDAWEITQLRDAVDATIQGFGDVVRALPADRESSERLVDGVFGLRARHDGNTVGYGTIAAAGAHACTLHWWRNDGVCRPGELLLLDAGVENSHLYTADITRTVPVSGRFSPVQRRVYEVVLAAQQAGIAVIRPGVAWRDIHRACMKVIAGALAEWGLLPVPAEESLDDEVGLHRRWTLHASGHMLGLDVHDCAKARSETYLDGVLAAGNVLTVEPGLYFQPDDETVPEEYRGIGVRIEDDVLVTADGAEVLSAALPREPDAVEAWMAAERAAGLRLPGGS